MSSVLAVVVSFLPDEIILENLKSILLQVSHVVVVDNQSSAQSQRILSMISSDRVTCIFNIENRGVAEGFNQGVRWGLDRGFDYFLLMDQDSKPQRGMVKALLDVVDKSLAGGHLALVGPRHEDFNRKMPLQNVEEVRDVPLLITSGSLLSRKLVNEIGFYDERLFIDHVDHDYCLRLEKSGGICLKVNSAVLLHKFGQAQVRQFLGKCFFLQNYSPFRRYYMMRNRIVLYKRYGMFRGNWFWLDLRSGFVDLAKLVFFEQEKTPKLMAVLRGLRDGILWRD